MRAGETIADRFVLEEAIGAGGMGIVFRAFDRATGRRVALKVLRRLEPGTDARFAREAEVLESLFHPAIVGFVARGTTAMGEPYLAMQWLEGETLSSRLRRGPLSVDEAMTLAFRVAGAMQAAHDRGVVHRDLKPANLFLEHGRVDAVKVLDFGIARLLGPGRGITATGALIGTPGFVSPEQVMGDRHVDARTDVFALGCVLYRCLCARDAFDTSDGVASILRVLTDAPAPLRAAAPHVPEPLADLVAWMLEKDPAFRPQDGGAVLSVLARLARGEVLPPRAKGPTTWPASTPDPTFSGTLGATVPNASVTVGEAASRHPGARSPLVWLAGAALVLLGSAGALGIAFLLGAFGDGGTGVLGGPTEPPCFTTACSRIELSDPSRASFDVLSERMAAEMRKVEPTAQFYSASVLLDAEDGTSRLSPMNALQQSFVAGNAAWSVLLNHEGRLFMSRLTLSESAEPFPRPPCRVADALRAARAARFDRPFPIHASLHYHAGRGYWFLMRVGEGSTMAQVDAFTCRVIAP